MKAGDKIRPKEVPGPHLERELLFVGKTQVVYRTVEDGSEHEYAASLSAVQRQFEVVPDFFEAGKTYSRYMKWSIRYQLRNVIEYFHVTSVENNRSRDGNERPVAIGYFSLLPGAPGRKDWGLAAQHEWDSEGWKED